MGLKAITSPSRGSLGVSGGNPDAIRLSKWRAALARVKAGTGNARLLCVGDSTMLGFGSYNSGVGDQKTLSLPGQLAKQLTLGYGINAHSNSFMGNGTNAPSTSQSAPYDPRITIGSSFGQGPNSLGGFSLTATTTTNALSFTPTANVDTFDVYYIRNSGLGTFSVDIGGTGTLTQSSAGAGGIAKKTITGSLGANTLNIKYVSGSSIFIIGVEAYDSSKKWVSVVNAGWVGSKSTEWASTASVYDVANSIPLMVPDLTLICLGINDWNQGTTIANYTAQIQTVITKAATVSDVVLMTPAPTNPSGYAAVALQAQYVAALGALAQTNNCLLVDSYERWQSYSASQPNGCYSDSIHPNAVGYGDQAQAVLNLIARP